MRGFFLWGGVNLLRGNRSCRANKGGKKMKLQTVWTRLVVVIYLVAVVGACLYVPMYISRSGVSVALKHDYQWLWVMSKGMGGFVSFVDRGRVALEVVSLTAIAGVLFLIGSFVEGRKRGKQSDPVNRE